MQSQWVQRSSTTWVGLSWRLVIPSAPWSSWEIRRGGLRGPRLFLNTQQQANAITGTGRQWPNQISREGRGGEERRGEGCCRMPVAHAWKSSPRCRPLLSKWGWHGVVPANTEAAGPHVHTNTDIHKTTQLLQAKRYPNKSTFFMPCMITLEALNLKCPEPGSKLTLSKQMK